MQSQTTDPKQLAFMRLPLNVLDEMVTRQFTDPQRRVLELIQRLSWGCGQEWAHIPHQKDFEVVGIKKNHIKDQLDWLTDAKVIDREGEFYRVNPTFEQWRVSRVQGFRSDRMSKLVHQNLSRRSDSAVPSDGTTVPPQGTMGGQHKGQSSPTGNYGSPGGNQKVPAAGTTPATDLATPIDSSIDSITSSSTEGSAVFSLFLRAHENRITDLVAEELGLLIDEYSGDDVASAIREAVRSNQPRPSVNYLARILERRKNGGPPLTGQRTDSAQRHTYRDDVPWYRRERPDLPLCLDVEQSVGLEE